MSMELGLVLLLGFALVVAREWWLEGSYPNFNKSWGWPRVRRPLLGAFMVMLLATCAHLWQKPGDFVMCSAATCEVRATLGESNIMLNAFEASSKVESTAANTNSFDWKLTVALAGIVIAVLTGVYFAALQNTLNSGKEVLRELRSYEKRFQRIIIALNKEKDSRLNIDYFLVKIIYEFVLNYRLDIARKPNAYNQSDGEGYLSELHWLFKCQYLADNVKKKNMVTANSEASNLLKEIDIRRKSEVNFEKSIFYGSLHVVWQVLQQYWGEIGGAKALQQYEGLTKLYYTLSQEFGQQDLLEDFD